MTLQLQPPLPPMEAQSVDQIPTGDHWQYEPKWDGFRCLVFRDGDEVQLQSKAGQPLARYFPELVEAVRAVPAKQFVLDSEIVIPEGDALTFDKLLLRLHPAESRIKKLASQTPAMLIVFDLLADARGKSLIDKPLQLRRELLDEFAAKYLKASDLIRISTYTADLKKAKRWFESAGSSLDGVMAKRTDVPYQSGERTGMVKVKPERTVDCVIGGFRYGTGSKLVGSLLLGLYDDDGLLHHVGFCSGLKNADKKALTEELEALISPPGFTGSAPGGPSRWATERSVEWQPLKPKIVVEVGYDHFTNGRFRHGTKLKRRRPDKAPRQCTMDQVNRGGRGMMKYLAQPT